MSLFKSSKKKKGQIPPAPASSTPAAPQPPVVGEQPAAAAPIPVPAQPDPTAAPTQVSPPHVVTRTGVPVPQQPAAAPPATDPAGAPRVARVQPAASTPQAAQPSARPAAQPPAANQPAAGAGRPRVGRAGAPAAGAPAPARQTPATPEVAPAAPAAETAQPVEATPAPKKVRRQRKKDQASAQQPAVAQQAAPEIEGSTTAPVVADPVARFNAGSALAILLASCVVVAACVALISLLAGGEPVKTATTGDAPAATTPAGGDSPDGKPAAPDGNGAAVPDPSKIKGSPAAVKALAVNAGHVLISGIDDTGREASPDLQKRLSLGQLGGVILMPKNIKSKSQVQSLVWTIANAANSGNQPMPLIMVDQEGGSVRRLKWVASALSAQRMAALGPAGVQAEATKIGKGLIELGINTNLAPVADVATNPKNFLKSRAFGSDPAKVAESVCAYANGLLAGGGVNPTLKHFPGLGGAGSVSTDDGTARINDSLAQIQAGFRPFAQCLAAPKTLVMVSNAIYPNFTGKRPAVFASKTYKTLRGLGYKDRPIITDDLLVPSVKRQGQAWRKALVAGANMLMFTDQKQAERTYNRIIRAVNEGELSADLVQERAGIVYNFRKNRIYNFIKPPKKP